MIRFATKKDICQLKRLWILSFQDSEAYTDFFFQNMADTECAVYEEPESGNIVSMLFLLKCSLHGHPGRYIFAACTQIEYRRQGIMTQLLDFVVKFYENTNTCDFLCLVPANKALFEYYAKAGFKTYFYNTILTLENNKVKQLSNDTALDYETFAFVRGNKTNTVQWAEQVNKFVFKENLFNGGQNIKTPTGYVIMREEENDCQIIEWLSHTYDVNELYPLTKCSIIEVRRPCTDEKLKHANGMLRLLNDSLKNEFFKIKYPYLSLVLD